MSARAPSDETACAQLEKFRDCRRLVANNPKSDTHANAKLPGSGMGLVTPEHAVLDVLRQASLPYALLLEVLSLNSAPFSSDRRMFVGRADRFPPKGSSPSLSASVSVRPMRLNGDSPPFPVKELIT